MNYQIVLEFVSVSFERFPRKLKKFDNSLELPGVLFSISLIIYNDLNKHIDYIHYNPMKHYNIAPKDWQYSSFNKFVEDGYYEKDWCNFEDKYDINKLDYE